MGKKGQSRGCWAGAGGDGDEAGHHHLQLRAQSFKKLQLPSLGAPALRDAGYSQVSGKLGTLHAVAMEGWVGC